MKKKGFTLVEILMILIILGIASSLAVISINKISNNAKSKAAKASFKAVVDAIKTEDLLSYKEGNSINVFSVKDKTSKNILKELVSSTESIQDGLIAMYGSYLLQANLCINGFSYKYDYETNEITEQEDADYCNYSDSNGLIKYNDITEDNKIVGLSYINPEYLSYLKLSDEEKENVDMIPEEFAYDGLAILKIKNMFSNLAYNNSNVVAMSNDNNIPSSYDLRNVDGKNYVTSVKDQKELGICWAYASLGAVESNLLFKNGVNVDLSERQLDYFSSSDGMTIDGNMVGVNSYTSLVEEKSRKRGRYLGDGSNYSNVILDFFTGLTVKKQSYFKDDYSLNKKELKDVINNNGIDYYVKEAEILNYGIRDGVTAEDLEIVKDDIKKHILKYGAIGARAYMGYDYAGYNFDRTKTVLYKNDVTSSHAFLVIGWDDNYEYYTDQNNKKKGVWIVKNSWGNDTVAKPYNSYFYLAYDTQPFRQYSSYFSVEKVDEKNWDKSYDPNNNITKNNYSYYLDKINGSEENITSIGYYDLSTLSKGSKIYVYDVTGDDYCDGDLSAYDKIVDNNDGTISYLGKKFNGYSIQMDTDIDYRGYKVYDVDNDYKFKNDICVVAPNSGEISIFTKNYSNERKVENNKINNQTVRVVTSGIEQGKKVDVEIYDNEGKDVTSSILSNKPFILNGAAEVGLKIYDRNKYYVKTKVDGIYADKQIVINGDTGKTELCSTKISNSKIYRNEDTVISVECYKTDSDTYHFDNLKDYISFENKNIVTLVESSYEQTDDKIIYYYKLKPIGDGKEKVVINKYIQTTKDSNYYVTELPLNLEVNKGDIDCYFSNYGEKNKKLYISIGDNSIENFKIYCETSRDITKVNNVDIDLIKTNDNIKNDNLIGYKKDSILKIENITVEKTSDSKNKIAFNISNITGLREGSTALILKRGLIENDMEYDNNEVLSSFNIYVTKQLDDSIECEFKVDNGLYSYVIPKNSESSSKVFCYSEVPFDENSIPKITANKYFGSKILDVSCNKKPNTILGDSGKYTISYEFNMKSSSKPGFTKLILEEGSIKNKRGKGNKMIKTGTIKVKFINNGCN